MALFRVLAHELCPDISPGCQSDVLPVAAVAAKGKLLLPMVQTPQEKRTWITPTKPLGLFPNAFAECKSSLSGYVANPKAR